jgi:hypothetical protein
MRLHALLPPRFPHHHRSTTSLFLRTKPRRANVRAAQLDAQDPLHASEDLLVGRGCPALEVRDDGLRRVAFCGEVLLRHFGLHLLALLRDDGADLLADGGGLDDVVRAVNLGEMLAFDAGFGGLRCVSLAGDGARWGRGSRVSLRWEGDVEMRMS